MKIKQTLAAAFSLSTALGLGAQSFEPFNPYGSISPSVETFAMTKYGIVSPSLHTGTMSYSVPVFTYQDPDFSIPISLGYNFNGYKPAQNSGTVGYGWFLDCGGAITREVRGMPDDDMVHGPSDRPQLGYFKTVADGHGGASGVFDNQTYWSIYCNTLSGVIPTESMSRSINPFSHCPTFVQATLSGSGQLVSLGGDSYDLEPDIYHFSFLGHSGDFILKPDGKVRVFNSDLPHGEIGVELTPALFVRYPGGVSCPKFTITTGDGTKYIFGGQTDGIDFASSKNTENTSLLSLSGSVSAFRLVRIEAPNGRTVTFSYSSAKQVSRSASPYYSLRYQSDTYNRPSSEYKTISFGFSSILDSISVDGEAFARFTYGTKSEDEGDASHYGITSWPAMIPTGITASTTSLCLDSIDIRNSDGEQAGHADLTHTYAASGTPKMFLSSVDVLGSGVHSFTYNVSGITFPDNDTRSTDHWGWWNGRTERDIREIVTFSASRYAQINGTWKDPDTEKSKAGGMTGITYPTGGACSIAYEGNSASRCLDEEGQLYIPASGSFGVGGVRVKGVTRSDPFSGGSWTRTYTYSDGFLFHIPRYAMEAAVDYVCLIDGNTSSIAYTATGYNSDCDYGVSRDDIIGYGTVTERDPDGSFTTTAFSSWSDGYADLFSDNGLYYLVTKRGIISHYDKIDCGTESTSGPYVVTPLSDRKSLRGKPLSVTTFRSDGTPRRKTEYSYGRDTVAVAWFYYNNLDSFIRSPWECQSPVLTGETTTDYSEDGGESSTVKSYAYNGYGQVETETSSVSGSGSETKRTYFKYLRQSDTSALPAALSDAARTVTVNGAEYLVASESYGHSNPLNVLPTSVTSYTMDSPVAIASPQEAFTAGRSGASRVTTITYDGRFRPTLVSRPGGAFTSYTWNGNNISGKTVNGQGNTWTYDWKDLVGLTGIVSPTGMTEAYSYDSRNRLTFIRDTDGNTVTRYDHNIINE